MPLRRSLSRLTIAVLLAVPTTSCERRNSALVHASEDIDESSTSGAAPPENYAVEDPTGRPLAQGDPAPMPAARRSGAPAAGNAAGSPSSSSSTGSNGSNAATSSSSSAAPAGGSVPQRTNAPDDDPRISRSAGTVGGVIVLWPRVLASADTAGDRQLAQRVQSHLRALVQRTLPGRAIDVRPEPERACRRAGCDAVAVGAVVSRRGDACLVVATVTPPGPIETTLVPMAGSVELTSRSVPHRDPPESYLKVRDFADCSSIDAQLTPADEAVAVELRRAAP